MPTVNPLLQWRAVINPAPARTVSRVRDVLAGGRFKCELKSGEFITLSGLSVQINDLVLSSEGQIIRKLSDLPLTEQAV